jgi:hypothetical protein
MRKQSPNWYIAATHYLTAGFVIPLLAMLALGLLFSSVLQAVPPILMNLIYLIVIALIVWMATIYSAKFLKKKYLIKDKNKIVNLSTLYLVCVGIISLALQGFPPWSIVDSIVMAVVFYLASKKYIEETSEEMPA